MSDNLKLWTSVEKTDPKHVTKISGKPYQGNSPRPHWLFYRATEVFGPCGIGWGFQIVSEHIEDGGKPGDKVHIARVRVWYVWDGQRGEVEHVGQTMFSGTNRNGLFTDEDAPKKSVTDAIVKALSMIGFAGDIFFGRWDDSKYVDQVRAEYAGKAEAEAEAEAPATASKPRQQSGSTPARNDLPSVAEYVERALRAIDMTETRQGLIEWWSANADMRKALGITGNSPEYATLRGAWEKRGKSLVDATIIDRTNLIAAG